MKARAVWVPGTDRYDLYMWEETPSGNAVASIVVDKDGNAQLGYTVPEPGSLIKPTLNVYGRELMGLQKALTDPGVTHETSQIAPDLQWIQNALDQKQADYERMLQLIEMTWSAHWGPRVAPQPSQPPPTPLKGVPNGND